MCFWEALSPILNEVIELFRCVFFFGQSFLLLDIRLVDDRNIMQMYGGHIMREAACHIPSDADSIGKSRV